MDRHTLIRLALRGLSAAGAARWLPAPADVAGFVVTLHHVRPSGRAADFDPNALLAVTPRFLDRFITHITRRGWRFVSLADITALAEPADPRRIAVTLDDGYRDNLEHAWPVFRRHAVPFTIFVCPGFCDRKAELWWEALERIIAAAESVSIDGQGPSPSLPTRTPAEKLQAFRAWTRWLTTEADEARQRVAIRALAVRYGLDLEALADELVMGWDDVRRIAADPLCTIGAHTMTHPALARLPPQAALREMRDSADRLESEIGVRPSTLAFPYGYPAAASSREASLAAEAGFAASFTTQPGFIRKTGPRHGLPRVSMNGLFQEVGHLDVLLTPGLWTVRDRLRGRI